MMRSQAWRLTGPARVVGAGDVTASRPPIAHDYRRIEEPVSPSRVDVLVFALAMKQFVTLILTVWLAAPAAAQTASTMTGRATDQNGGVLPGVAVTVRNLGTRLTRTATTGAEGRFTIAGLPAGSYELTAELQGFRTVVLSPVTTTVGEAVDVN